MNYQLIFKGELLEGKTQAHVLPPLSQMLRCEEALLAELFDGQAWLIRETQDVAEAQRYVQAFQRAGAVCQLHEMDAEQCLENKPLQVPQLSTWQLEAYPLAPKVVSRPQNLSIQQTEQKVLCYASSPRLILGSIALFIALATFSAFAQRHFTTWWVQEFGTGLEVTLISIVFYFLLIYLPFVGLQAQRRLNLHTLPDGKAFLQVRPRPAWRLWLQSYDLRSDGRVLGSIQHNLRSKDFVLSQAGKGVQFYAEALQDAHDTSLAVGFEVQSQLMNFAGFARLRKWVMKGRNASRWKVMDAEQHTIAVFSADSICQIALKQTLTATQKQQLAALFAVMTGF